MHVTTSSTLTYGLTNELNDKLSHEVGAESNKLLEVGEGVGVGEDGTSLRLSQPSLDGGHQKMIDAM